MVKSVKEIKTQSNTSISENYTYPNNESYSEEYIDMDQGIPYSQINTGESPVPVLTWTNRRRMAWGAFFTIIAITASSIFLIPTNRLESLNEIIITVIYAMVMVIAAYMGFTTLPFLGKGRK